MLILIQNSAAQYEICQSDSQDREFFDFMAQGSHGA